MMIIIKITRKILETKVCHRKLTKIINTWAVLLVRYSRPFLKCFGEERRQIYQRTRKLMTMHKALHPSDDVDRLYVSRNEGGRGFTGIEHSIDTSIQQLDYVEKFEVGLITTTRNNTNYILTILNENRMTITRKQNWEEKQMYGHFKQLINNISHEKTWTWLRKGYFKRETESLPNAAQNNAIRNNHIKAEIDKRQQKM